MSPKWDDSKLKEMSDGMGSSIQWAIRPDNYRVLYIGQSIHNILGLSTGRDLYQTKITDFFHYADLTLFKDSVEKVKNGEKVSFQHRFFNEQGHSIWFQTELYLSLNHTEIFGLSIDISNFHPGFSKLPAINNEDKLRAIYQFSTDLICIATLDGYFTEVNPAFEKTLGYSERELLEVSFLSLVHPDDVKRTRDILIDLSHGKIIKNFENRYRRKDGVYIWLAWMTHPISNSNFIYAISRDVSDKKKEEEKLENAIREKTRELSESREFLELVLENFPQMVFVKDAKDLRFIHLNRAGEELLGRSRSELVGKNDYDFFPKTQADFFNSKDLLVLSGEKMVDISEEEISTPLGIRILRTKKVPIFGKDNKPTFLLGFSEDITEWKKREKERVEMIEEQVRNKERARLQEKELFLANVTAALASSLDAKEALSKLVETLIIHFSGWATANIIKMDGTLERVAIAHADPSKKTLIDELNAFSIKTTHFPLYSRVLKNGESFLIPKDKLSMLTNHIEDEDLLDLYGQLGLGDIILVPMIYRNSIHGVITIVHPKNLSFKQDEFLIAQEIGKRTGVAMENIRLYEAAQKAISVRDEFLSIASHELKTPVTALKLQLQMTRKSIDIEKGVVPTAQKLANTLDQVNLHINKLTKLIEDLLDVSRIGMDKIVYNFEKINISQVVKEMCNRYAEHLTSFGCHLETEIEDRIYVFGDKNRLEQVILNLLTNAAKFGDEKPVKLLLKISDNKLLLSIHDHGIGIPKEKLEKIFDRFERIIDSRNISGLGLGLYISREIIKSHKGRIWAESDKLTGTIFKVELPIFLE